MSFTDKPYQQSIHCVFPIKPNKTLALQFNIICNVILSCKIQVLTLTNYSSAGKKLHLKRLFSGLVITAECTRIYVRFTNLTSKQIENLCS